MCDKHWTDEQLVARLYGLGPEDGHLDVCEPCAQRWETFRRRHESIRPAEMEAPEEYLAAQRRAIFARLGEKRRRFPRVLVPVLASILLAGIIVVYRASLAPPPTVDKVSDSQLFEDVFRRVSDTEPNAVVPIRSLFEEPK
jgi:hypothetical protein